MINGWGAKGGASSHKLMPKTMLWAMEVGGKGVTTTKVE